MEYLNHFATVCDQHCGLKKAKRPKETKGSQRHARRCRGMLFWPFLAPFGHSWLLLAVLASFGSLRLIEGAGTLSTKARPWNATDQTKESADKTPLRKGSLKCFLFFLKKRLWEKTDQFIWFHRFYSMAVVCLFLHRFSVGEGEVGGWLGGGVQAAGYGEVYMFVCKTERQK